MRFSIEIFAMKHQYSKFIFAVLTSICATVSIFAQTTPTPTPKVEEEVLKIESRLVVVPVSVTDANGLPVTGLKAQDFRIAEENKNQEIAQVSDAEKVPLEIALLFDISASTDSMFQFEQETAAQFLKEVMRPIDRATIITVGERPVIVQARDTAETRLSRLKQFNRPNNLRLFTIRFPPPPIICKKTHRKALEKLLS